MPLFPVDKGSIKEPLFCGPTALCAVTGLPADDIYKIVNHRRILPPRRSIVAMRPSEFRYVLTECGIAFREIDRPGHERIIRAPEWIKPGQKALIMTKTHILAYQDEILLDTIARDGRALSEHPYRRVGIDRIYLLEDTVNDTHRQA